MTGERKREPLEYIRRAGEKNSNGRTEHREPMKAAEKYFFIRELRSNEKLCIYIYINICIYVYTYIGRYSTVCCITIYLGASIQLSRFRTTRYLGNDIE